MLLCLFCFVLFCFVCFFACFACFAWFWLVLFRFVLFCFGLVDVGLTLFCFGLFVPQIAIAIGVRTSNREGAATNHLGGLEVAPTQRAIAGCSGCAIAGCHRSLPL